MGSAYTLNPVYIRLKKLFIPTLERLCTISPDNVIDHQQDKYIWSKIRDGISEIDITKQSEDSINIYLKACDEAINGFVICFNAIKDNHKPLETPLSPMNKIRKLAGNMLLYIGDLMRYKLKAAKKAKIAIDQAKAQDEVLQTYMDAKFHYPFEGKIYNQLALILVEAKDSLGCMYYFVRCIFCEVPFICAQETLVKHFEKINLKYGDMVRIWSRPFASKTGSKPLKTEPNDDDIKNAGDEFWISFFRLLGIIFNKIDCDKCKEVNVYVVSKLKAYLEIFLAIKTEKLRKIHIENLSNIVLLMIFAVHFSTFGPLDKNAMTAPKRKYTNKQALENDTGLISLNTLSEILGILSSIIIIDKSETYSIVLPLCYWLSLNTELREHLWAKHKAVKRCLSTVYRTLMKIEFEETIIVQITNMLSDDYKYIGFVPLDDIILNKDKIKIDEDIERKVRLALIKTLLSKMDWEISESELKEEIKRMPNENFFKGDSSEVEKIHDQVSQVKNQPKLEKPLIVIDVQNVAMKYGNGIFLCKGIEISLNFWKNRHHEVVGFMPDYLLNDKEIARLIKLREENPSAAKASKIPDDVNYLKNLHKKGIIVTTPPQDYDDSYCIEYAKKNKGYMVTNDKFRDHINSFDNKERKNAESLWIKRNRIGFAFKGDEFLPNPDAEFFKIYGEDD